MRWIYSSHTLSVFLVEPVIGEPNLSSGWRRWRAYLLRIELLEGKSRKNPFSWFVSIVLQYLFLFPSSTFFGLTTQLQFTMYLWPNYPKPENCSGGQQTWRRRKDETEPQLEGIQVSILHIVQSNQVSIRQIVQSIHSRANTHSRAICKERHHNISPYSHFFLDWMKQYGCNIAVLQNYFFKLNDYLPLGINNYLKVIYNQYFHFLLNDVQL